MLRTAIVALSVTILACASAPSARGQHRLMIQGNNRLAIVERAGDISWEMPWGAIHDIHVLPNGNVMAQQGTAKVVEVDYGTREILWSYDAATENGNQGRRVEVHAFQPLEDGHVMIAESGPARIIEIDRDHRLLKELKLKVIHPDAHSDTRLVRKLKNEHYLVSHEADGCVREYAPDGRVVWEYEIPLFGKVPKPGHGPEAFGNRVFAAVRLANGNTLIATGNGHSVIEVTPEKEIVWKVEQNDLPKITLAWVTTLEILPNGNYVIGNCHAGPDQPLIIELNPKSKKVLWTYDGYSTFGNSASNSILLDVNPPSIR